MSLAESLEELDQVRVVLDQATLRNAALMKKVREEDVKSLRHFQTEWNEAHPDTPGILTQLSIDAVKGTLTFCFLPVLDRSQRIDKQVYAELSDLLTQKSGLPERWKIVVRSYFCE